jgi:type IV pilus modification protein PilV
MMIMHAKKQGITLIELLITLMVLTIGIAALIKFQGSYFYYYDVSKQRAEALVIAKKKMESLRAYEVIPTTASKVAYNDIVSGSSSSTGSNASYTTTWTVTTNTDPDYKTVNMVVSWTDRRGVSQNATLTSIISKTDPATNGLISN